jgi:hypothetical protein
MHEAEPRDEHDRADLVGLLSETIGEDTASRVFGEAARSLGHDRLRFTRSQALATLERISLEPGLVGLTARLAVARFRVRTLAARGAG